MKSRTIYPSMPRDSIQTIQLSPDGKILAAASWDQNIYLYDTILVKHLQTVNVQAVPLSIIFVENNMLAIGCSDGQILLYNHSQKQTKLLGKHSAPVRTLNFFQDRLFSAGYDEILTSWNLQKLERLAQFPLPGRPFASSNSTSHLTIAISNREILTFDDSLNLINRIESPLRHQTRFLAQNEQFLTISSVEGRVAVEGTEKFAFRAHKTDGISYPVHGLALVSGCLVSCGADGQVYFWDLKMRKKIFKISESGGVSSVVIGGNRVFIAKSYMWENGNDGKKSEEIGIVSYDLNEILQ
ncbi:WD domain, G-beta repeat-containing protein [Spironucleus salmonicida]|uniref:WD domain, G-beta repeat-containing protein n=1 Tax=Spironucleus salmonicida TaxID=348837 RepID=V6LH82_9EUKA|nr:WD domain, G-beta repeat-containing protein [Spironucleus salmonicida]|eukprot:EST43920.1 WD domain, G-beta repeat-containing protein [Spironucleus salmonicida]